MTSSESNNAANDPSTILGVACEFGPILAKSREVPNDSFFSLISEKFKKYYHRCFSESENVDLT